MKTILFDGESAGRQFALLYQALFESTEPIRGMQEMRAFNRIADALEAVSEGNEDAVNAISQHLDGRHGTTIVRILTINRKLTHNPARIELEDADFAFLWKRIELFPWSGLAARDALSLMSKLEEIAK